MSGYANVRSKLFFRLVPVRGIASPTSGPKTCYEPRERTSIVLRVAPAMLNQAESLGWCGREVCDPCMCSACLELRPMKMAETRLHFASQSSIACRDRVRLAMPVLVESEILLAGVVDEQITSRLRILRALFLHHSPPEPGIGRTPWSF